MLFGKKKKAQPIVESTPVTNEYKCQERNCVRCGATCTRSNLDNFRCKFCGTSFTDEDAERIEEQLRAARNADKTSEAPATAPSAPSSTTSDTVQAVEQISVPTQIQVEQPPVASESINATVVSSVSDVTEENASVSVETSSEDIYANNCNGVVEIVTDCGRASGLIISKKGLVLTNAHAVLDQSGGIAENIYVKINGNAIRSQLIAIGNTDSNDANNVDLALLKIERVPQEAVSLCLGRSSNARIGQHIYYIGNSKGEGLCMTAGIISDNNRKVGQRAFIMTDAATNPGNSGGPLFNDDGMVIGIHVSARVEADGMKYAIPVNTARAFLNTIEDKLEIPRDTIADNLVTIPETTNESLTVGAILTLVLSGIAVLVKGLEFAKEIADIVE